VRLIQRKQAVAELHLAAIAGSFIGIRAQKTEDSLVRGRVGGEEFGREMISLAYILIRIGIELVLVEG